MSAVAQRLAGDAAPPHAPTASRLGRFPWILLAAAAGLAAIAGADALSRTGSGGGGALFWLGLVLIVFPAALRLVGEDASGGERVATVVLIGLALYGIKVLRDPFAFTYGDELAHLHNLQQIDASGRLFGSNSILPITPRYPGLESVAAGLSRTSGSSNFAAGLLLIALARTTFMVCVYLIYERLTGSARLAGLGALLGAAAPTFLFFSAQFSYESLAVPLASVALLALARRQTADGATERRRWSAVLVLAAAAVIPTHHITSYALVALLLVVCVLQSFLTRPRDAPWLVTAVIALLTIAWLTLVASRTVGYLSPVLSDAVSNIADTIRRESGTRTLFRSTGGDGGVTPLGERVVAIGAIALLASAILAGLVTRRHAWRRQALLLIFGLAAALYLCTLPLRVVPAAWETASRSGSFLFIGVGVTAAAGILWWVQRGTRPAWAAAAVTLMIAGGVIAGWPASLRLGQPFRLDVAGTTLEPPGVAAARWSRARLGPARRLGAQDADARTFLVDGRQTAFQGVNPDIRGVLDAERLEPWQRELLRENRLRLLVTDRRTISSDNIAGYFFDRGRPDLAPAATVGKFDLPTVDRLYDSGDIVVFDVRGLW